MWSRDGRNILLNETVRCLRMSYDFARASMTVAKIKDDEMINSMMLLWCVLISIISSGPPGLWVLSDWDGTWTFWNH